MRLPDEPGCELALRFSFEVLVRCVAIVFARSKASSLLGKSFPVQLVVELTVRRRNDYLPSNFEGPCLRETKSDSMFQRVGQQLVFLRSRLGPHVYSRQGKADM